MYACATVARAPSKRARRRSRIVSNIHAPSCGRESEKARVSRFSDETRRRGAREQRGRGGGGGGDVQHAMPPPKTISLSPAAGKFPSSSSCAHESTAVMAQ